MNIFFITIISYIGAVYRFATFPITSVLIFQYFKTSLVFMDFKCTSQSPKNPQYVVPQMVLLFLHAYTFGGNENLLWGFLLRIFFLIKNFHLLIYFFTAIMENIVCKNLQESRQ